MVDYKIVNNNIVENQTGLTVKICKDNQEAKKECREYNLGKGFSGWTPQFILEQITTFG